ncbi:MAG TPA: FKBP-type peptidyl-prolyl cis-trans isomerase, partial [Rhodoferax sp.]
MNSVLRLATMAAMLTTLSASWAADATLQASAKESGAVVTASGLVYRSLKDGTGASPQASDTVKVNYRGTFPDGREFDSSYKRNQAIEFPLGNVIP